MRQKSHYVKANYRSDWMNESQNHVPKTSDLRSRNHEKGIKEVRPQLEKRNVVEVGVEILQYDLDLEVIVHKSRAFCILISKRGQASCVTRCWTLLTIINFVGAYPRDWGILKLLLNKLIRLGNGLLQTLLAWRYFHFQSWFHRLWCFYGSLYLCSGFILNSMRFILFLFIVFSVFVLVLFSICNWNVVRNFEVSAIRLQVVVYGSHTLMNLYMDLPLRYLLIVFRPDWTLVGRGGSPLYIFSRSTHLQNSNK